MGCRVGFVLKQRKANKQYIYVCPDIQRKVCNPNFVCKRVFEKPLNAKDGDK